MAKPRSHERGWPNLATSVKMAKLRLARGVWGAEPHPRTSPQPLSQLDVAKVAVASTARVKFVVRA